MSEDIAPADAGAEHKDSAVSPAQREAQALADAQQLADRAAGWQPGTPYEAYAEEAARLLPQFVEGQCTGGGDDADGAGGQAPWHLE